MFGRKKHDPVTDEPIWVPEATDRDTRSAVMLGMDALEDYANTGELEHIEACEELWMWSATSLSFDLGVI